MLDEKIQMCRMCVIGGCEGQVSGMTCRNGVKTWLLNKVKAYAEDMPVREEQYFAFLDRCAFPAVNFLRRESGWNRRFRISNGVPMALTQFSARGSAGVHPVEKGCGKCVKACMILVQEPTRRPLDSLGRRW